MNNEIPPGPHHVERGEPDLSGKTPLKIIEEFYGSNFHEAVVAYVEGKWNEIKHLYVPICIFYLAVVLYISVLTVNVKSELSMADDEIGQHQLKNVICQHILIFKITLILENFVILYKVLFDIKSQSNIWEIFERIFFNVGVFFLSSMILLQALVLWWKYIIILLNIFTWLSLLNFIMTFPRLGAYVLVVKQIFLSFLKFAPVFVMFILPFSISFHLLLDEMETGITQKGNETETILQDENKDSLLTFFNTFVQTLVMMIGELDFKESVAKKESWFTTSLFCVFLFLITIFLMNLLTGIAVTDASELLQKALKKQKTLRYQNIRYIEDTWPRRSQNFISEICKIFKGAVKIFTSILSFFKFLRFPNMKENEEEEEKDPMQKLENELKNEIQKMHNKLINEFRNSMAEMENRIFGAINNINKLFIPPFQQKPVIQQIRRRSF